MTTWIWLLGGAAVAGLLLFNWKIRNRRREAVLDAIHEARRPLAAVMLGLDCVAREASSSRVDSLCLALGDEIGRAALALDGIGVERKDPRIAVLDLVGIAEQIARAWGPLASRDGRQISLQLRGSEGLAEAIGDWGEVSQAASNLVANAVEHGSGPVDIGIERKRGKVSLVVSNSTVGLAAQSQRGSGRGRGLRIASGLARRSGGRLVVSTGPTHRASLELVPAGDDR